jgi:hypothetical protein
MAEVQKQTLSGETTQRFIEFVMMQAHQAALFLGQAPHPQTGEPEVNLDVARMFIDQLAMIQEKTRGNLTSEETKVLSNALSNLQMAYVEVSQESGRARPEPARRGESAPETQAQESHAAAPLKSAEQPPAGAPEPSAPMTSTEPETESRKKFTKSYGP